MSWFTDVSKKLLQGTNNIDKMFQDKVAPYFLMEEIPQAFQIGTKTVFVGNLTIENNSKFWKTYAKILANLTSKIMAGKFAEDARKQMIEKSDFFLMSRGADMFFFIQQYDFLYKDLLKIIHKTICKQQGYYLSLFTDERKKIKWETISFRYFIKNMTIEKLIQMVYMIYMYNFDSEKKNLKIILNKMVNQDHSPIMDTYMSYYYQNMAGLTGTFQLAQLTSSERSYHAKGTDNENANKNTTRNTKNKSIKRPKRANNKKTSETSESVDKSKG